MRALVDGQMISESESFSTKSALEGFFSSMYAGVGLLNETWHDSVV